MGDSITEGWGAARPDFWTAGRVNRGISGQTTPQMLIRFEADVIALHPRVVHILAATNDIAGNTGPTSPQDARNNIMAMASLAKAAHIKVILGSISVAVMVHVWPAKPKGAAVEKARRNASAVGDEIVKKAQSEAEAASHRAEREIATARDQALAEIWSKTAESWPVSLRA